jgi:peptidoglycan/LPS O-acetylase OafA/YrhL
MYGILAAQFKKSFPLFWEKSRGVLFLAGLGLLFSIGFYLAIIGFNTWFAKTLLFSVISLGAAFLLPFFDQWQISKENIFTLGVRYISLWSYSLYLCNVLIAFVVNLIYAAWEPGSLLLSIAAWFTFYILCFLFSAFLYRYFEKPIMDLRKHFPASSPRHLEDIRN